jgi:hypothetical protein
VAIRQLTESRVRGSAETIIVKNYAGHLTRTRNSLMSPDTPHSFRDFFKRATALEHGPYPYQERLATEQVESRLTDVPMLPNTGRCCRQRDGDVRGVVADAVGGFNAVISAII